MKLYFVADVHAGNHRRFGGPMVDGINERCHLVTEALAEASQRANGSGLFILGDLFDVSNPTPQVVALVQDAFGSTTTEGITILRGNHDQVSSGETDDALGPLQFCAALVREPFVRTYAREPAEVLMVPFQAGPAHEWFPPVVAKLVEEADGRRQASGKWPPSMRFERILCFHLGIADEKTPEWLRGAHDSIDIDLLDSIMVEHGIQLAVAGNWHNHQIWRRNVPGLDHNPSSPMRTMVQCGALAPTGFDNPGLGYGKLVSYDTKTGLVGVEEIPGPRFVKIRYEGLDDLQATDSEARLSGIGRLFQGTKLYVEVGCSPAQVEIAREKAAYLLETKLLAGFDVVPDAEDVQMAARGAAAAARGAATTDQAMADFVAEMPLEPGVDRVEVLAIACRYYASAGDG